MSDPSADQWYYSRDGERRGPVPLTKLRQMTAEGWLSPEDMVSRGGVSDWIRAKDSADIFPNPLARLLRRSIAGVQATRKTVRPEPALAAGDASEPRAQPRRPAEPPRQPRSAGDEAAGTHFSPRHLVAACGALMAALGIAFTAIASSSVAVAFLLSGLFIAVAGLHVEVGRFLSGAAETVARASREAADRRLRAKELSVEKLRLDLEAARLASERVGADPRRFEPVPAEAAAARVVVVSHPPVRRWSPGLAAVLSLLVPGLGQLYKGQFFRAVAWFVFVCMGYAALVVPGLVLHFFCVLGALSGNPWTEARTTVVRE